jgi:hypothetical protein
MTFNKAIEHLLNGERVRCKRWAKEYFIEYAKDDPETNYGVIHEYYNDTERDYIFYYRRSLAYKPVFSLSDTQAEWELYTDELSQNNHENNLGGFMIDEVLEWREPKNWKNWR